MSKFVIFVFCAMTVGDSERDAAAPLVAGLACLNVDKYTGFEQGYASSPVSFVIYRLLEVLSLCAEFAVLFVSGNC